MKFYINGARKIPASFTKSNTTNYADHTMFTIGRRNDDESGYYMGLVMRSLVIWDTYLYPKFVHKLMGITSK